MSSYYRAPSCTAYYIPPTEEVVTWAPDINTLDSVMPDIYAACVEQRLYADLGAPLPVWLTEGMGLFFSTAKYNKKEFRFETGAPHREYLQAFKRMHPVGQPVPDLAFFFTQTRLGLEKTGIEGQAGKADLWGFMYFLIKSPDENVKKILPVELPHVAETHHLVLIEKTAATPPKYPRRSGMPSKRPLAS